MKTPREAVINYTYSSLGVTNCIFHYMRVDKFG